MVDSSHMQSVKSHRGNPARTGALSGRPFTETLFLPLPSLVTALPRFISAPARASISASCTSPNLVRPSSAEHVTPPLAFDGLTGQLEDASVGGKWSGS